MNTRSLGASSHLLEFMLIFLLCLALSCNRSAKHPAHVAAAPNKAPPESLASFVEAGVRSIVPREIEGHVRYLSDDLLEGRGTGTRGHEVAAAYVASEFRKLGLEPAGDNGSYFQRIPLRVMKRVDKECSLSFVSGFKEEVLKPDEEVIFNPFAGQETVRVKGELVYVGFGLSAPEFNYDDVGKQDLKGKIAVLYWGAPRTNAAFFPPTERAVYSDTAAKTHRLKALGAQAVLLVASPEFENQHPWKSIAQHYRFERIEWMNGDAPGSGAALPIALISQPSFERIVSKAKVEGGAARLWEDAISGKAAARGLGIVAELKTKSTFSSVTSPNVVGIVRGSDPVLSQEVVVVSAHLDHLGVGTATGPDTIYNGAVDNACGSATMLTVARALSHLPQKPRRSVIFLSTTGEEKGLVGSDYFAGHPTVPLQSIVAVLNLDAQNPMHETFDVVPLGADHSSLIEQASLAASAIGMRLSVDPNPELVFFIRSDQYSFVKRGVPSVFPFPGFSDNAGRTEVNEKLFEEWFETRYHKPADEWQPSYNAAFLAKEAHFNLLLAVAIANAQARPRWNDGDFFARHQFLPAK